MKTNDTKHILILFLLLTFLLSACGTNAAKAPEESPLTAKESAEQFMENLRSLNLDYFNQHSDNYVSSEKNWLGVTTRKEYQVFSELLQPFHGNEKRYQANHRLAESLIKNLTWEITDVHEENAQAEIHMKISNIDMAKATGYYEIALLENMIAGEGTGFSQLVKDISGLARSISDTDNLILAMEKLTPDDLSTINITLNAYQENGIWKFHLNDDFINAFMGDINSADYSPEIEERINELTLQYEQKMTRMATQFEKKVSGLAD